MDSSGTNVFLSKIMKSDMAATTVGTTMAMSAAEQRRSGEIISGLISQS